MIGITLPDGSVKQVEAGTTPMDVAKSISEGLARNVISASFNDEKVETATPLTTDGSLYYTPGAMTKAKRPSGIRPPTSWLRPWNKCILG